VKINKPPGSAGIAPNTEYLVRPEGAFGDGRLFAAAFEFRV